jgi:hypothetical protein
MDHDRERDLFRRIEINARIERTRDLIERYEHTPAQWRDHIETYHTMPGHQEADLPDGAGEAS